MNVSRLVDWHSFHQLADNYDPGSPGEDPYFFRGQASADWRLEPTLLRHLRAAKLDEKTALSLEERALELFRTQAHHHLDHNFYTATTDTISWWTVMQHHGAPTRLLDWTSSIYVAAYFACLSHHDDDAAIWVVHPGQIHSIMTKKHGDDGDSVNEDQVRQKNVTLQPSEPPLRCSSGFGY